MNASAFIALLLAALAVLLIATASLGAFLALWLFDRRLRARQVQLVAARLSDALLLRRLAYIERVVFEPEAAASQIDDPLLAQRLLASQVHLNKDLFSCAAALEEAEEGKHFENRPANTYARYLRPRFQERGWAWPSGLDQWRAFLEGLPHACKLAHQEPILISES